MSEIDSLLAKQKSKQDYSRNVKKLKIKLTNVTSEIMTLQKKIDNLKNTSNDKLIALKIAKFCKERNFTPEMLFRFADKKGTKTIPKIDFQETLKQLGLKLSKDELLRVQYLIDEDLSGEISYVEYVSYLQAFGIKKQFSATQNAARQALSKIDMNKLFDLIQGDDNGINRKKKAHLLNYQEFIKYCHKNFPNLKNKQLASIFQKLSRNYLINLQDLLDYLKDQQRLKRQLQQKNRRRNGQKDSMTQSQIKFKDNRTLKGLIEMLLKSKLKTKSLIFHAFEFSRLQRILSTQKGELINLFKAVDKKRKDMPRGSFTHNQLANYYIYSQQNGKDLTFAFEIMGNKLQVQDLIPINVVSAYSSNQKTLNQEQLQKFFMSQFDVSGAQYRIITGLIPRQADGVKIQVLAQILQGKGSKSSSKDIVIRPDMLNQRLVFRSGFQALRCCLELEGKLAKARQRMWSDYEFGPTDQDQYGIDSIEIQLPSKEVLWTRCSNLGMVEFYEKGCTAQSSYSVGSVCPSQTLAKTIYWLLSERQQALFSSQKIDKTSRKIAQQQLLPLFKGIYPLAFRPFAKYGIYVIKLFINQKWRYIVIDDKIPTSQDNLPYFSSVQNRRFSYISLIEKALAKMYGSYRRAYLINDSLRYIIQLANMLPKSTILVKNMQQTSKNQIWDGLLFPTKKDQYGHKQKAGPKEKLFCLLSQTKQNSTQGTGISKNYFHPIVNSIQFGDPNAKNKHKSHRLLAVRLNAAPTNQEKWNSKWSRQEANNKYTTFRNQIQQSFKNNLQILRDKNGLLLNYQLFREIFDVIRVSPVHFPSMIILRKMLQISAKGKCVYMMESSFDIEFVLVLERQMTTTDKIVFQLTYSNSQKSQPIPPLQHMHKQDMIIETVQLKKDQKITFELYTQNGSSTRANYTIYMQHPRFELQQKDDQKQFRYVSPYQQDPKLIFDQLADNQKTYIYRNFYEAAESRGCC